MTYSTSPSTPDPTPRPAPDAAPTVHSPTRRNWLALASFLLSFSPLVVWIVTFAFSAVLFPATPATNYYAASGDYTAGYFNVIALAAVVSLVGSVSAIITSRVALRRAKQTPELWRPAWPELAQAGTVLGILGIVVDCIVAPCAFVSIVAQNYHGG